MSNNLTTAEVEALTDAAEGLWKAYNAAMFAKEHDRAADLKKLLEQTAGWLDYGFMRESAVPVCSCCHEIVFDEPYTGQGKEEGLCYSCDREQELDREDREMEIRHYNSHGW